MNFIFSCYSSGVKKIFARCHPGNPGRSEFVADLSGFNRCCQQRNSKKGATTTNNTKVRITAVLS